MSRKRVGAQLAPSSATIVAEISPLAALLLEFPNGFQSEPRSACISQGVLLHQILLAILCPRPIATPSMAFSFIIYRQNQDGFAKVLALLLLFEAIFGNFSA